MWPCRWTSGTKGTAPTLLILPLTTCPEDVYVTGVEVAVQVDVEGEDVGRARRKRLVPEVARVEHDLLLLQLFYMLLQLLHNIMITWHGGRPFDDA